MIDGVRMGVEGRREVCVFIKRQYKGSLHVGTVSYLDHGDGYKNLARGRVQWLTPIIPALWEVEVGGSRGQQIETNLVNMVKPRLY